jgi:hypothetical protein
MATATFLGEDDEEKQGAKRKFHTWKDLDL